MERLLNAMTVLSVVMLAVVLFSVRRSHIRVEYSVSWLAAAVDLLGHVAVDGPSYCSGSRGSLDLADPPLALVILVVCVFVMVICRLSVEISGPQGCEYPRWPSAWGSWSFSYRIAMNSGQTRKPKRPAAAAIAVAQPPQQHIWPYFAAVCVAVFAVFKNICSWPAVRGPFLLDDSYLPYQLPRLQSSRALMD